MKIYAISDLHMSVANPKPMNIFGASWNDYLDVIARDWAQKVTDDDVVLIAGDISWAMNASDALLDMQYFNNLKGKKVFIRGNHDYWWKSITNLREKMPENCFLLQNDAIKIENTIICGSRLWLVPGSPDFCEKDQKLYLREIERLKLAFFKAQALRQEGDNLICMTHYPPFNVKRESNAVTELIEANSTNAVIYGHLHGKDARADKLLTKNGVKYYLTSCDLVNNKLVEIDV